MSDLPIHPQSLSDNYAALLETIGDARFVLIGEASHGTHEFYRERAHLTRLLIEQKGFTAVAVEADWPDAYRINRFVRGLDGDDSAEEALGDFHRFPRWMWRNTDVQDFVTWLRGYNQQHPQQIAGFYGLDLYSLHRSTNAVVDYLRGIDPDAAERARERYACFELFGPNPQAYGYATELGEVEPCEEQAVQQLLELQRRESELARGGLLNEDEHFYAEQNARLARNAENYYRSMFRGREESWNIRDTHMAETLAALDDHLRGQSRPAKIVVWAHNSHLGDARASAMGWQRGQLNLGQLIREKWPQDTFIIGQTTYAGAVFASDNWEEPGHIKTVNYGITGSLEERLHKFGQSAFWLNLRDPQARQALADEQLQRFIGVIYRPETERWSHYVETRPAAMYDALLHFDTTTALTPLDSNSSDDEQEWPATFPSGE